MMLTAAILTLNESAFIGGCITSIEPGVDRVVVFDAGSTDDTVEVARGLGAEVVHQPWAGFPGARNSALRHCSHSSWVLFLDADERVTPALRDEITSQMRDGSDRTAAYWIPRRNLICGRVMRGGGWWPDYQLRLLRPEQCRYSDERAVHETVITDGPTLALSTPLIHLNYRTWSEFVRKQLSYASLAAAHEPAPRRRSYLGAPSQEMARRFICQGGYRDGAHGLIATTLVGASEAYRVWRCRANER